MKFFFIILGAAESFQTVLRVSGLAVLGDTRRNRRGAHRRFQLHERGRHCRGRSRTRRPVRVR